MVSGIATLLGALPDVFDTDDMRTAFLWLEKFVRNPWSHDDANTYGGEAAWPAATKPYSLYEADSFCVNTMPK